MQNETTLIDDNELNIDYHQILKNRNKKFLYAIILLSLINIPLYIYFMGAITPNMPQSEAIKVSLMNFLLGLPIWGFILGIVGALFPYKGLPYSKKYLHASLLVMIALQIFFLLGIGIGTFRFLAQV